jgi:hypothetical protein
MGEVPLYVEGGVVAACDAQYSTATRKLHARTSAAWVLQYMGTLQLYFQKNPHPIGPLQVGLATSSNRFSSPSASQARGTNLERFKDFSLKAKSRIWP